MDVRCDRCETEYELDDAIVTDAGASVQCTTCGHTFIVTRRPSSPLNHMGLTPPGGTSEPSGPEVPEWTLSTDDGKVHRFRDLIVLQKWIVERKVSRNERISRGGGPWLALEDVVELTPFFKVVDEADRARASTGIPGGMPTAPTFRAPSGGWSSGPAPRSPSAPHRGSEPSQRPAGTPPPVPFDARRSLAEDGPTVPNRRLPAEIASAFGEENESPMAVATAAPSAPVLASAPPPALAPRPLPGMRDSQPLRTTGTRGNGHRATEGQLPSGPSVASAASAPAREASAENSGRSSRPAMSSTANATAAAMAASANEGIRRAGAAAPRSPSAVGGGHNITTETHPLERELLMPPSHGNRNALVAVAVLVLGAAGGGVWWWQKQQREPLHGQPPAQAQGSAPGQRQGQEGREPADPSLAPSPAAAGPANAAERTAAGTSANSANPSGNDDSDSRKQAVANGAGVGSPDSPPPTPARAAAGQPTQGTPDPSSPRAGRASADLTPGRGAPAAGSYDRLVAEADRLLERGKTAKADKLYTQALAARPEGVSALTGAGYVLLDRQRHFKAIETFRRALAIQPTFGPALFGIAESYRARGDTAQALGAYRQYLAIAPTGSDAPAARRQIKDLESAGTTAPVGGGEDSAPSRHPAPETPALDQDTN